MWDMAKIQKKLIQCPNYEQKDENLMETLYRSLNSNTKLIVDNTAGGAFMALSFVYMTMILDRFTKNNRA